MTDIPPIACVSDGHVTEVLHYRGPCPPAWEHEALVRVEHPDRPAFVRIVALADITLIPIAPYLIGDPP